MASKSASSGTTKSAARKKTPQKGVTVAHISEGASITLVVALIVLYVLAYPFVYPLVGFGTALFVPIPVLVAAWFSGLRRGMIVAVLLGVIAEPLLGLWMEDALLSWPPPPGVVQPLILHVAPTLTILLLIAFAVGRMRDLSQRLQWELKERHAAEAARERAETALREANAKLEKRVVLRTLELEHLNRKLEEYNTTLQRELRERTRMQHALRESEARLAEAQRIARVGSWEWDMRHNRSYWSEETYRMLGYEPDEMEPTFEHFLEAIHPEDRERLRLYYEQATTGINDSETYFRIVHPDGSERVLRTTAALVRDDEDVPVRVLGTCMDVTQEKQREADLLAAKEKAEEMARLKSAFLANMSHEIRTPLTAIIGFAQVLSEELDDPQRTLVEPIERGGKRLMDTIGSVLDLSRLEAGEMPLALETVSLNQVARDVMSTLQPLVDDKGITLSLRGPEVEALLDPGCMRRMLYNLVGNAIKFTSQGGVTIEVARSEKEVRLKVIDTGIGIDAQFLPHLFEDFKQESTGLSRSHEGSGLGLSITKRLVELHGGTINVASKKGVGTAFLIRLPVIRVAQEGDDYAAVDRAA